MIRPRKPTKNEFENAAENIDDFRLTIFDCPFMI